MNKMHFVLFFKKYPSEFCLKGTVFYGSRVLHLLLLATVWMSWVLFTIDQLGTHSKGTGQFFLQENATRRSIAEYVKLYFYTPFCVLMVWRWGTRYT
jgi:hypothetical protein